MPSVEEVVIDVLRATATKMLGAKNDLVFCDADVPRIGIRFLRLYVD
jgi:hypothetical protein